MSAKREARARRVANWWRKETALRVVNAHGAETREPARRRASRRGAAAVGARVTCPHRVVRQARVIPDSDDERRLAMHVALAIALATNAPVEICTPAGNGRGWVTRGRWCTECEAA